MVCAATRCCFACSEVPTRVPDRERVLRTLTFWLRPRFVLRVVNRFQKVAGFDRAIALASGALTAIIPLAIVTSTIATQLGGKDAADRIIDRYDLTGGGAEAVKDIFSPPAGADTSIGLVGTFLLLVAVLSFTRGVQRMFEQTWELKPLSVRNTLNGLKWIAGSWCTRGSRGARPWPPGHGATSSSPRRSLTAPLTAAFLYWSGRVLSAGRISRPQLLPFALIGTALLAVYSVGAVVYIPHLFSSYATRYGVIGAVFAMISALFCVMVVLVGSAAAGREVADELDRIRSGERPADDDVRRQWDEVTAEARLRWDTLRSRRRSGNRGRALAAVATRGLAAPAHARVTSAGALSIGGALVARVPLEPAGVAVGERRRGEAVGEDREPDGHVDREHDQVLVRELRLLDHDHREDDRRQAARPEPAEEADRRRRARATPTSRSRPGASARP